MPKYKMKLIMAAVSMGLAVILLVSASLAWLTISTHPEIGGIQVKLFSSRTLLLSRDTEELDFKQYIDLSQDFAYLVPLRPVSTVDGLNWFIPTYNGITGELKDPSEFILDNTLTFANVSTLADGSTDENPVELTGDALQQRSNRGYYVYTDFWMMTEEENGCIVRLTIPHTDELHEEEQEQGAFGSYVLQTYELTADGEGSTVALLSRSAETAMRVGFLLNHDGNEEYADVTDSFFIYEPNADKRSDDDKPLAVDDSELLEDDYDVDYIVDYRFVKSSYIDGQYFVTKPIGIVTKTKNVLDNEENNIYNSNGNASFDYEPVNIPQSKLLIQKASRWDIDAVQEKLEAGLAINSNDVMYPMGGFLNTPLVYGALEDDTDSEYEINNQNRIADISEMQTSIAGSSMIVKLKKETPLKIRLFIWIEGQDVDCWNDISAGSFIVSLELAGETIEETE